MTHCVIDINEKRGDGQGIAFERPEEPLRIELLGLDGEETLQNILFVDTRGLEAGIGALRISRAENAGLPMQTLRVVPPLLSPNAPLAALIRPSE